MTGRRVPKDDKLLAQRLKEYRAQVRRRASQNKSMRAATSPEEISDAWNWDSQQFGSLARDAVVARRGALTNIRPSRATLQPVYAAGLDVSVGVHAIGPRLERGLQVSWHTQRAALREMFIQDLDAVLGEHRTNRPADSIDRAANAKYSYLLDPVHFEQEDFLAWLEEIRRSLAADDFTLDLMFDLWMHVFSHLQPRDTTFVNQIIRQRCSPGKYLLYIVDGRTGGSAEPLECRGFEVAPGIDVQIQPLLTAESAGHFVNAVHRLVRRRMTASIGTSAARILGEPMLRQSYERHHGSAEPNEITRHFGTRILRAIRHARPRRPWTGIRHSLEQLQHAAAHDANRERLEPLWAAENPVWQALSSPAERWGQMMEWILLLERFLISHASWGPLFYLIVPPPIEGTSIRMCFTVGAQQQLGQRTVEEIVGLTYDLRDQFKELIHTGGTVSYENHRSWLPAVIGRRNAESLEERFEIARDPVIGGLPFYLAFAERLAARAMHEGMPLRFDIVVSDGVTRYEKLETLASYNLGGRLPPSVVEETAIDRESRQGFAPIPREDVLTDVLANFAFFQRQGAVLLGNRRGRLLALARILDPDWSPETLTANPSHGPAEAPKAGEKRYEHTGCYLVRVTERGEIQVFFRGTLILWRRLGSYMVVRDGGGETYRQKLEGRLDRFIREFQHGSSPPSPLMLRASVLANVIWRISERPGLGAMFVLGRFQSENPKTDLNRHTIALAHVLPHAEGLPIAWTGTEDILHDLAIQDGAVVIDVQSGLAFGRRSVRPTRALATLQKGLERARVADPGVGTWGTRHLSSFDLSIAMQDRALIVTVSSDGDISVFHRGQVVPELRYPNVVNHMPRPEVE